MPYSYQFHVLDISIFIGAQSVVGQSDWFWNNQTMIEDEAFPTSDTAVCQQITWPLTYRDSINLRPKRCEDEAYFMCQVKCE